VDTFLQTHSLMPEISKAENPVERSTPKFLRGASATGDLRIHEFDSRIFRNSRFLRVWLPLGYDDAENVNRRYPVLYLNDGQNLFEAAIAFGGVEWQVDDTAGRLIREGAIPPLIIVGIDHAGKDRMREYMPHRSLRPPIVRVRGSRYPDFLIHEVMPFVAGNYRVAVGPENTGLGGSSLGALIALYTAIRRPGLIGRLLLESPSLWVSNRQPIRESRTVRIWPERIYLATGTAEAGSEEKNRTVVDDMRELAGILRRAKLDESRLRFVIEEGASHSESAWAHRLPDALKFLFWQTAPA
jgi:predicted alpha/beta superfamily hydrolase